jgi:hypothetical protein
MATVSTITLTVKMLSGDILSTTIDKDTEMADIYTIVYHLLPEEIRSKIAPEGIPNMNTSHQLRLFSLSDDDLIEDIKQEKIIGLLIERTILSVHCNLDSTRYRDRTNYKYSKYMFKGNYYFTDPDNRGCISSTYRFTIYSRKAENVRFFILESDVGIVETNIVDYTPVSTIEINNDAILHTFIPYHKMDFYNKVPDYLRNAMISEFERKFQKRISGL